MVENTKTPLGGNFFSSSTSFQGQVRCHIRYHKMALDQQSNVTYYPTKNGICLHYDQVLNLARNIKTIVSEMEILKTDVENVNQSDWAMLTQPNCDANIMGDIIYDPCPTITNTSRQPLQPLQVVSNTSGQPTQVTPNSLDQMYPVVQETPKKRTYNKK